ncbi:putative family protein [Phaeoacremonium minimum UCRPA7]|uniref:Putative family protein n=1 Tax=Phaeoacremonium minimum (strain UCR-PA7) TaxID=1286976 RepID=R8BXR8_PHAM7|nr:putative family protein [Phaeoacremonium minimum UCRPA7]EOO04196.1 putative family protein [Phaeoacremonium minimum UCRPA7]
MATYLITQATGQQSRWVITHLLAAGASVHAVVRNLQKVPAALNKPGITLFEGESTNFDAIYKAAQGCKGAFLNTFPIPGVEAQQAKTVVEACKKAGVEAIVASTTFCTGNKEIWSDAATEKVGLVGYYTSKAAVEEAVRNAGLTYTIVRPAVIHWDHFLPSVLHNFPALPVTGELDHAFDEGSRMAQTDGNDVGRYAAAALLNPAKFGGQEIDLGNENLTIEEVRDILARVSGRAVRVRKKTPAEIEAAAATVSGQRFQVWANSKDFTDVVKAAAKARAKFGMPLTSLEDALRRDKAQLLECLPA